MDESFSGVSLQEMGRRFALIRRKIGYSQRMVAREIGTAQTKVSQAERGGNVFSGLFLSLILFYLRHVSAEMLFSRHFDIDDPRLFDRDYTDTGVAKARIDFLCANIRKYMEENCQKMEKYLRDTSGYL